MDIIQQMSDNLANQIAAGEVVERPASVVKELVENSIDAGATHITIELLEAGIEYIKVSDNGVGMSASDLHKAFLPHATSKIYHEDDLFNIRTLGFRGEALASIASISHVTIESKRAEDQTSYQMVIHGGEPIKEGPNTAKDGTRIVVENLFYNTPARLKHLKSIRTELWHITRFVQNISLAYSQIRFELYHNHQLIFHTYGTGDLIQAIATIYQPSLARELIEVKNETNNFAITGYISSPVHTRSQRHSIHWIVNGRPVHSNVLDRALIQAYGRQLMTGRYPLSVIAISIDPRLVDVNVHPTKYTVRISEEEELNQLIQQTVQSAINLVDPIPKIQSSQEHQHHLLDDEQLEEAISSESRNQIVESTSTEFVSMDDSELTSADRVDESTKTLQTTAVTLPLTNNKDSIDFDALRYVGQIHGTYLIAEHPAGFYLIDQHAAQEIINYHSFMHDEYPVQTQQTLLVPETITMSTSQSILVEEYLANFKRLGIYLESFGPNSYKLDSIPIWIEDDNVQKIIIDLIELFDDFPNLTINQLKERSLIMKSCKSAIKANYYLDDNQASQLIKTLGQIEHPYHCPHGRPVLINFSKNDIEKMFKRIQDSHQTDPFDPRIIS